jgi:hypothetical protein
MPSYSPSSDQSYSPSPPTCPTTPRPAGDSRPRSTPSVIPHSQAARTSSSSTINYRTSPMQLPASPYKQATQLAQQRSSTSRSAITRHHLSSSDQTSLLATSVSHQDITLLHHLAPYANTHRSVRHNASQRITQELLFIGRPLARHWRTSQNLFNKLQAPRPSRAFT